MAAEPAIASRSLRVFVPRPCVRLWGWWVFLLAFIGATNSSAFAAAPPAQNASADASGNTEDRDSAVDATLTPPSSDEVESGIEEQGADASSPDPEPRAEEDLAERPLAEPPQRDLLPGQAGACALYDPADPLVPIANALESLRPAGFRFGPCHIEADVLRGRSLHINIQGQAHDLLLDILERAAVDGYEVLLAPRDADSFDMVSRLTPGVRGVRYIRVRTLELDDQLVPERDRPKVRRIATPEQLNFYPSLLGPRLREIGYRSDFIPTGPGQLQIRLKSARSLRRVRVYGQLGLPEREIIRALSIAARPGALARGRNGGKIQNFENNKGMGLEDCKRLDLARYKIENSLSRQQLND